MPAFFSRGPKIEDVQSRLAELIRGNNSSNPEALVPAARNILTEGLAKRLESSEKDAKKFVGSDQELELLAAGYDRAPLSKDIMDTYLKLVLQVVETWIGSQTTQVRLLISNAGWLFHTGAGRSQDRFGAWSDAEREYRLALEFARLQPHPNARIVFALENLDIALSMQNRHEEVKGVRVEAFNVFHSMSIHQPLYDEAHRILENMQRKQTNQA